VTDARLSSYVVFFVELHYFCLALSKREGGKEKGFQICPLVMGSYHVSKKKEFITVSELLRNCFP
jgi:hypothetical protein